MHFYYLLSDWMSTIIKFNRFPLVKCPDWNSTLVPSGLKLGCAWSGFILVFDTN